MKWRATQIGDVRERRAFAWLPIACEDEQTRWLEFVEVRESYEITSRGYARWIVQRVSRSGGRPRKKTVEVSRKLY